MPRNRNPVRRMKLKPLTLISRDEWGALPPREGGEKDALRPIDQPVPKVIIAYTRDNITYEEDECVRYVRDMQKRDMENGLADIRYNFVVCGNGTVYEGRGWQYRPAESTSYPEWYGESYEIAHMGFHGKNLPDHMAKAAWDIVKVGINNKYVIEEGPIYPDIFDACFEGLC